MCEFGLTGILYIHHQFELTFNDTVLFFCLFYIHNEYGAHPNTLLIYILSFRKHKQPQRMFHASAFATNGFNVFI